MYNDNAIGERKHFIQIAGVDDDSTSSIARSAQLFVHSHGRAQSLLLGRR